MEKVCPKCGSSSKDVTFKGTFCKNCSSSINKPLDLPLKVTIYTCRDCGVERVKNWNEDSIESSIISLLKHKKFGYPEIEILNNEIKVNYEDYDEEISIKLIRKESICDNCTRKNSNYYEAIIQIRGKQYTSDTKMVDSIINALEKSTFISNITHLKEGIDLYVGDKMVARSILSSMRLKPKVTYKLYGVKDGERVYRTTFLIKK